MAKYLVYLPKYADEKSGCNFLLNIKVLIHSHSPNR